MTCRYIPTATLVLLLSIAGCGQPQDVTIQSSPDSFVTGSVANTGASLQAVRDSVLAGAAQLIDVRSDAEWDECHLAEATHISMATLGEEASRDAALAQLDKSQPVYVHCKMGGRAKRAAKQLKQCGFEAQSLEVSFEELPPAGFTEVTAE